MGCNLLINNPKEFNQLHPEKRRELLKEHGIIKDPLDLTQDAPLRLVNPFTFELKGDWEDGEHFIHNPFTMICIGKFYIKDGVVIEGYNIGHNNEFIKLK